MTVSPAPANDEGQPLLGDEQLMHLQADVSDVARRSADDHCLGMYCLCTPIELRTAPQAAA